MAVCIVFSGCVVLNFTSQHLKTSLLLQIECSPLCVRDSAQQANKRRTRKGSHKRHVGTCKSISIMKFAQIYMRLGHRRKGGEAYKASFRRASIFPGRQMDNALLNTIFHCVCLRSTVGKLCTPELDPRAARTVK